jgi:hypothetical protein
MPVNLLSFKATFSGSSQAGNAQVNLTWITASEIDNQYFTVERAGDDLHFIEIMQVPSQFKGSTIASYQFNDHYPLPGKSYYRLKQTDVNGKSTYSKTLAVQSPEQVSIILMPNPLHTNTLRIYHTFRGKVSLTFLDIVGRCISPSVYSIIPENDGLVVSFSEKISPGLYTVQVCDGISCITRKLMVP